MDEEPQYDYAYSNSELVTNDERRQRFITGTKQLALHVMHQFTNASMNMASQTETPRFNEELVTQNGFESGNPLEPKTTIKTTTRTTYRPQKRNPRRIIYKRR